MLVLLTAHSACHVCRINNTGLHFYDDPTLPRMDVIYSLRKVLEDYDSDKIQESKDAIYEFSLFSCFSRSTELF